MSESSSDNIYSQVDSFYRECIDMSNCANTKADLYRVLSIISSIVILICGISTAVLSRFNSEIISSIITVTSGIIISVQIFLSIYTPEKKAGLVKKIAQSLKKISRDIRRLKSLPADEIPNKLEGYHLEVDDLDLSMFNIALSYNFKSNETVVV